MKKNTGFKKLLTFLIAMILLIIPINAFADPSEQDPLDHDTAVAVLKEAYDLRSGMGRQFRWFEGIGDDLSEIGHKKPLVSTITWTVLGEQGMYEETWELGFLPVKEGFGPDDVKAKINRLFERSVAEKIIEGARRFFGSYTSIDGKICFAVMTPQFGFNAPPKVYAEEADIDNARITSTGDDTAIAVISAHRYEDGIIDVESRVSDFEVTIFFKKNGDLWQISGADLSQSLLTPKTEGTDQNGDFSLQIAKNSIKAAVFDIYYCFAYGACELLTDGFKPGGDIYVSNADGTVSSDPRLFKDSVYVAIEGEMGKPDFWRQYGNKYCTPEVLNSLMTLSGPVVLHDGRLYTGLSNEISDRIQFSPAKVTDDRLKVVYSDANRATVKYTFPVSAKYAVSYDDSAEGRELTFEFVRTGEGWKISGGDFVPVLDAAFGREANAATSDNNTVFACLVSVLIALAVVAGKRTRSRMK